PWNPSSSLAAPAMRATGSVGGSSSGRILRRVCSAETCDPVARAGRASRAALAATIEEKKAFRIVAPIGGVGFAALPTRPGPRLFPRTVTYLAEGGSARRDERGPGGQDFGFLRPGDAVRDAGGRSGARQLRGDALRVAAPPLPGPRTLSGRRGDGRGGGRRHARTLVSRRSLSDRGWPARAWSPRLRGDGRALAPVERGSRGEPVGLGRGHEDGADLRGRLHASDHAWADPGRRMDHRPLGLRARLVRPAELPGGDGPAGGLPDPLGGEFLRPQPPGDGSGDLHSAASRPAIAAEESDGAARGAGGDRSAGDDDRPHLQPRRSSRART